MNIRIASLLLSAAAVFSASAQGLHKEINVDRKVDPQKRDAARITVLPTLQLPSLTNQQLTYSDRVVTARIPAVSPLLQPMAYGDKTYTSPYRGYLRFGIGAPSLLGDVEAGYRAISTSRSVLSLWTQYSGDTYTASISDQSGDDTFIDHTASVGADFRKKIGSNRELGASLNYTYAYHHINIPYLFNLCPKSGQSTSRVNADVSFASGGEGLRWDIAARYRHFGFYHIDKAWTSIAGGSIPTYSNPARQNQIGGTASAALPMGDNSALRLTLDADILRTGKYSIPVYPYTHCTDYRSFGRATTGLGAITPAYTYKSSLFAAVLGAKINVGNHAGNTFHIAPDVTLAWTPSQLFGLEVKATGGSELNSLASLYDVSPFLSPFMAYYPSHIPLNLDARLSAGPFLGAYIELFGGYAKANDWLMPIFSDDYPGFGIFDATDISAWHAGAAVGYDYRNLFSLRVSYQTAPNDYDKAYYLWRDRARHVLDAELKVRPMEPLTLTLGWQFRGGRRTYSFPTFSGGGDFPENLLIPQAFSLGCQSDLSLSGVYAVNDRLTLFARGENLLNRRYWQLGLRKSQGIHGLIGASLKF